MNKYIYCILDSGQKIQSVGKGYAGRNLYGIAYQELSALVSDVSTVDCNEENILLHEEVIERTMLDYSVLPMRFGTVLDGEGSVKAMLSRYYQAFVQNFARLRDCVEMGLKIIWPVEKVIHEIAIDDSIPDDPVRMTGQTAGVVYLKRKYAEYQRQKALEARADRFVQRINSILDTHFEQCRLKKLVTEKMVLNGAYLVTKDRMAEFDAKIGELKRRFPELKFLLTGPWPPYNFIELKEGEYEP